MSPRGRSRNSTVSAVRRAEDHPDLADRDHRYGGESTNVGFLGRIRNWVHDGPLVHSYYALAASAILLFAVGAMMVLSSSAVESISADRSAFFYFQRQVVFGVVGILVMFGLSLVPSRVYERLAPVAFGVAVIGVFLVIPFGTEINGNQNWINVAGFTMQPSEAAKLAVALMLGWYFVRRRDSGSEPLQGSKAFLWPSILIVGVPVGFVAYGDDAGTAIIFFLIYAAALFFAGAPWRLFVVVIGGVAALGTLAVVMAPHRMERVTGWITGNCDASGSCWQAEQGLAALATGGWWGVGLGQSRSKYNYVPEAHNDYIFAIIGEELGLIGTVFILALFAVMAVAMARVILRSNSLFERVTTAAILAWLIGQAFVNIGMVTGALPVIGVPLPFISYGGSSLFMCLAAVGVVMSFTRFTRPRLGAQRSRTGRSVNHRGDADSDDAPRGVAGNVSGSPAVEPSDHNVHRLPSRAERIT